MVYSKKTWVSNEVITTAALNNIEGGVENAYKTSEMIGDGTLDMSGNAIQNISSLEVNSVLDTSANGVAVPSQRLQYSKDAEGTYVGSGTYTEKIAITLGSGHDTSMNAFYVEVDVKAAILGQSVSIQLRSRDQVLETITTTSDTYQTIRQTAHALGSGDKIAVYILSAGSYSATIRNFRIYADYVVKTVGVDGGSFS